MLHLQTNDSLPFTVVVSVILALIQANAVKSFGFLPHLLKNLVKRFFRLVRRKINKALLQLRVKQLIVVKHLPKIRGCHSPIYRRNIIKRVPSP